MVFRAQDGPKLVQVGRKIDQVCSKLALRWLKLAQVDPSWSPSWPRHGPKPFRSSPLAFGAGFFGRDTQRETASSRQVAHFRGPRLVGMHNLGLEQTIQDGPWTWDKGR